MPSPPFTAVACALSFLLASPLLFAANVDIEETIDEETYGMPLQIITVELDDSHDVCWVTLHPGDEEGEYEVHVDVAQFDLDDYPGMSPWSMEYAWDVLGFEGMAEFASDVEHREFDLLVDASTIIVHGFGGHDRIQIDAPLFAFVEGGPGSDTIIACREGGSRLWGGEGNDELHGGALQDFIYGGPGNDDLYGYESRDELFGEDGHDEIHGGPGRDLLQGGAGNDDVFGGDDGDWIYGQAGNDELHGDDGDDEIQGNAGDDDIFGGEGNDELLGHEGDDFISGGDGVDHIEGGDDDDILEGNADPDAIYGGLGEDEISGGPGNDWLEGGFGMDVIHGDEGDDDLYGQAQRDELYGGPGEDYLDGGGSQDFLDGGFDGDVDMLVGDHHYDTFLFRRYVLAPKRVYSKTTDPRLDSRYSARTWTVTYVQLTVEMDTVVDFESGDDLLSELVE